jgi:predicted nucleic acid-binding protein
MILVDTNIIIDFWDKPTEVAKRIFEENDIAICGVIKAELLRGSNSEEQFSQMENALKDFFYLSFSENDWHLLAKEFILLKKHGLVVPFQDAMIACLAIKNNCEVWTNDKHFKLMQTVLSKLKLSGYPAS